MNPRTEKPNSPSPAAYTARKPPRLRRGDTIGVMAPSSPVKPDYLVRGVTILESLGFEVTVHPQTYERTRFYTAGDDTARTAAFEELVSDQKIRAIFLARGGYGSIRMLPLLDPDAARANPKIVMGSSDTTSLLLHLRRSAELVVFHGPMTAGGIAGGRADFDTLLPLMGGEETRPIDGLTILHDGSAEGRLEGGCLSLVAASIGTPHEIDTDGALLFLEDTGVKPYQIDRMLTRLELAGKLEGVSGIIFGEMLNCSQHPDQGYTTHELLAELTGNLGIPVFTGLPSGHAAGRVLALPFGISATMSDGNLDFLEKAVD